MKRFQNLRLTSTDVLALLLPLLVLSIPLAVGAWYLAQKYQWAQTRIDGLEPRYARILGLQANVPMLDKAIEGATVMLERNAYPAKQDESQAGNAAQQQLRGLFSAAGMEVVSSQILPAKSEKHFDRIAISMRVEGMQPQFQAALVALASARPSIWVEGFSAQHLGNTKLDAPRISVQLNLYVLRARS